MRRQAHEDEEFTRGCVRPRDRAGRGAVRRHVAGARRPVWWISVLAVILAAVAPSTCRMGGQDSDEGRWPGPGRRAAKLLGLRSRALACNLAVIVAFVGLTAAIAARAAWWWPFLVILGVAGSVSCSACGTAASQKRARRMRWTPGAGRDPR